VTLRCNNVKNILIMLIKKQTFDNGNFNSINNQENVYV